MLIVNSSNASRIAPSDFIWPNLIALITVNTFYAFSGVFLNTLVLLSFWKCSQLRRKVCYIPILVLASIDLLVVTTMHPLLIVTSIDRLIVDRKYGLFPDANASAVHLLCGFSLLTVVAMNIERYLAIVHPYLHQRFVTKRRLLVAVLILWSLEIIEWSVTFKRLILEEYTVFWIAGIFVLIVYINCKLLIIARKKKSRDATLVSSCTSIYKTSVEHYKVRVVGLKMAWTCIAALACYFLCFCPIVVFAALYTFQKKSLTELTFHFIRLWADTFLTMNSTFNCLIFFWKNRTLRNEGMKLLKSKKKFTAVSTH